MIFHYYIFKFKKIIYNLCIFLLFITFNFFFYFFLFFHFGFENKGGNVAEDKRGGGPYGARLEAAGKQAEKALAIYSFLDPLHEGIAKAQ